jgi:hypothetical protein
VYFTNLLGAETVVVIFETRSCTASRSTELKVKIALEQEMKAQKEVEL